MTLHLYTAPLSYRGEDAINVSRWGNDPLGVRFAPSERLLYGYKRLPRKDRDAFAAYSDAYRVEMRRSYATDRAAWDELLARERATICCYCRAANGCHRSVLAAILAKLGAVYEGERPGKEG